MVELFQISIFPFHPIHCKQDSAKNVTGAEKTKEKKKRKKEKKKYEWKYEETKEMKNLQKELETSRFILPIESISLIC